VERIRRGRHGDLYRLHGKTYYRQRRDAYGTDMRTCAPGNFEAMDVANAPERIGCFGWTVCLLATLVIVSSCGACMIINSVFY
jgi:hypothetical protein